MEAAATPIPFADKIAKSSQVLNISYDPKKLELAVVFQGGPAVYAYQDVPPELWEELQAADSIGSFLHHKVKKAAFRFVKLDLNADAYAALVDIHTKARARIDAAEAAAKAAP